MLSAVKHLAVVLGKIPARDPSVATLCQDDTDGEDDRGDNLL